MQFVPNPPGPQSGLQYHEQGRQPGYQPSAPGRPQGVQEAAPDTAAAQPQAQKEAPGLVLHRRYVYAAAC